VHICRDAVGVLNNLCRSQTQKYGFCVKRSQLYVCNIIEIREQTVIFSSLKCDVKGTEEKYY
jgi:hypothetical protein